MDNTLDPQALIDRLATRNHKLDVSQHILRLLKQAIQIAADNPALSPTQAVFDAADRIDADAQIVRYALEIIEGVPPTPQETTYDVIRSSIGNQTTQTILPGLEHLVRNAH